MVNKDKYYNDNGICKLKQWSQTPKIRAVPFLVIICRVVMRIHVVDSATGQMLLLLS